MKYSILFISFFLISLFSFNVQADNIEENDIIYVNEQEMTIHFHYGDRTGTYSGGIKNELPHGIGKFESINESGMPWKYIGEWENGHFNGTGISIFSNDTVYVVNYSNDYMSGNGIMVSPDSTVYLGELDAKGPNGNGTTLSSFWSYNGEFKNGLRNGIGTLYLSTGIRYEGNFIDNLINGDGTYYLTSGERIEGTFKENINTASLDGNGVFFAADNNAYSCTITDGKISLGNLLLASPASSNAKENYSETETMSESELEVKAETEDLSKKSDTSSKQELPDSNNEDKDLEKLDEDSLWTELKKLYPTVTYDDIKTGKYCGSYVIIESIAKNVEVDNMANIANCDMFYKNSDGSYKKSSIWYCFFSDEDLENQGFLNGKDHILSLQDNDILEGCYFVNHDNSFGATNMLALRKIGTSDGNNKLIDSIYFSFQDSVPNDKTGNWRLATTSTSYDLKKYALNYYKSYFQNDKEIHAIVNKSQNITASLSILSDQLYIVVHKYIDGEENDAAILFSGDVIKEFAIDIHSGDIIEK